MAIDLSPGSNALQYTHFNTGFNPIVQTPPFTIFARVNVHSVPGSLDAAIYKIDRIPPGFGGNFWYFMLGISRSMRAFATANAFSNQGTSISSETLTLNTWNNIVGVFKSGTSRTVYLNGVAGAENTTSVNPNPGLEGVLIGASHTSTAGYNRPYSGCIQDVTVWDRELTAEEIGQLQNGTDPTSLHTTDIVLYVPFADAATATDAFEYTSGSPVPVTLNQDGTSGSVTDCPGPEIPDETGEDPGECGIEDEADAMSACDVTWPTCDLVPSSISVDVVAPTVSPGRSFSGFEQLVQPDAGHWRIVFHDIPVRTRSRVLQWREIESTLNGRNGTVCVPVYAAKLSATPIAATSVNAQPIDVTSIDIEQTAGEDIRAGMHFSAGEWLYLVTRIESDEEGALTVAIWPPLRAVIAQDEALDFNTPRCRCRLETDDGMDISLELLKFGSPSVVFIEDV